MSTWNPPGRGAALKKKNMTKCTKWPTPAVLWQLPAFLMAFDVTATKGCESFGLFSGCLLYKPGVGLTGKPYQLPLRLFAWYLLGLIFLTTRLRGWWFLCFFYVLFSLPSGWRPTCRTGWTTLAPLTRAVSTTTMRTPPSAPGTTAPTDTGPMSTTTTINKSRWS